MNQIGEAPVLIAPIPTTTDAATDPRNTTTLRGGCRRPTVRGLLGRICWSLRKAMIEPQNESDPMIAAKRQATTSGMGGPVLTRSAVKPSLSMNSP